MQYDHLNQCYKMGPVQHLFSLKNKAEREQMLRIREDNGYLNPPPMLVDQKGICYSLVIGFSKNDDILDYFLLPTTEEFPENFLPIAMHPNRCGINYVPCSDLDPRTSHNIEPLRQQHEVPAGTCASLNKEECLAAMNCEPMMGARFDLRNHCRTSSYKYVGCAEQHTCGSELVVFNENEKIDATLAPFRTKNRR